MLVRIVPSTPGAPAGKLAEAEVYFDDAAGPLSDLKLVGFTVWKSKTGPGQNVTFPARQYSVDGERRHFLLLRAGTRRRSIHYETTSCVRMPPMWRRAPPGVRRTVHADERCPVGVATCSGV